MTSNYISATLSLQDRDEIMAAIATIRDRLPFVIDVAPKVKRSMPKMGDKSRAFVQKALDVAIQNPDFLPRSFDIAELQRDVELFEKIYPLAMALTQLQADLDDTLAAVGSDAFTAALQVYRHAKAHGDGSGLDTLVEELGQRFDRQPRKKAVAVEPAM
ncbi:hypothetical protein IQ273_01035 [Nodosilinea sp. LEGE 07298]|uniref:hypothetical protein n=1 Tax=Nodosilinea sp. LEGE 07298 TaxID=2777970 RepID=UPI001882D5AF|nr:hypothetical protein [Nodosilinea sp. LEGE 07298]MBE9108009.1 hypothetical protein [Nodosilinea sp. LEGE 07298]